MSVSADLSKVYKLGTNGEKIYTPFFASEDSTTKDEVQGLLDTINQLNNGVNLFSTSGTGYVEGKRLDATGGATTTASTYATTGYIKVLPGMTYDRYGMQFKTGGYTRLCTYAAANSTNAIRVLNEDTGVTIAEGENYVRFSFLLSDKSTVYFNNVVQSRLKKIDSTMTVKTRIDFNGTSFTLNGSTLNFKQLHDIHLNNPDFAFVVYGDRAYLLSYVQDDTSSMRELRFQSTIATTGSDGLSYTKTSGIYVTSSNGVDIASVRVSDINSQNVSYKATSITDANKNSNVWYPSNKAVVDYVNSKALSGGGSGADLQALIERIEALEAAVGGANNIVTQAENWKQKARLYSEQALVDAQGAQQSAQQANAAVISIEDTSNYIEQMKRDVYDYMTDAKSSAQSAQQSSETAREQAEYAGLYANDAQSAYNEIMQKFPS